MSYESTTGLTGKMLDEALSVGEELEECGEAMTLDELMDRWLWANQCMSYMARFPEPQGEMDDDYTAVIDKIRDTARAHWLEATGTTKESLPTC